MANLESKRTIKYDRLFLSSKSRLKRVFKENTPTLYMTRLNKSFNYIASLTVGCLIRVLNFQKKQNYNVVDHFTSHLFLLNNNNQINFIWLCHRITLAKLWHGRHRWMLCNWWLNIMLCYVMNNKLELVPLPSGLFMTLMEFFFIFKMTLFLFIRQIKKNPIKLVIIDAVFKRSSLVIFGKIEISFENKILCLKF